MTKQAVIYLLILLVGLAGGTGIGFLVTKSRLDAADAKLDELNTQLEAVRSQAEADVQTANAKVSRLEAELVRARNDVMRKKTELERAQAQMTRMKSVIDQTLQRQQPTGQAPTAQTTSTRTTRSTTTASAAARTTPSGAAEGVRDYTIKDGDSLWKIATTELGNGMRYKDILTLNPGLTENTVLTVGATIKIPAR
jgi:nucleoid-associated protein YgaU